MAQQRRRSQRRRQPPLEPTPLRLLDLPFDVVTNILLRLPLETLKKLRCVSKTFKTRISDIRFIKTLIKRGGGTELSERLVLLMKLNSVGFILKSYTIDWLFNRKTWEYTGGVKVLQFHKTISSVRVIGLCDGFTCMLLNENYLRVWNPTFGVLCSLPTSHFNRRRCAYRVFGFGYDCVTDDLKVVAIVYKKDRVNGVVSVGDTRYKIDAKLCSLRDPNWRNIQRFKHGLIDHVSGEYVDGHVCWPYYVSNGTDSEEWKIVSFNFMKELYVEVPLPAEFSGLKRISLGVLNGWLCIMYDYSFHYHDFIDFWVLKEFGVRESWSNFVSISLYDGFVWCKNVAPVYMCDDGTITVQNGTRFVIYDSRSNSLRFHKIDKLYQCHKAFVI